MSPDPERRPAKSGSAQALVKAEKLTQLAFILPISALAGWLLGSGLDKVLHQHWIYIAGLVLGVIAGFVQLFRMISEPSTLAGTEFNPHATKGPGYSDPDKKDHP